MDVTTRQPPNKFVAIARKVYNPVGFQKGYNFVLWFIFAGALMGFSLSRMMYFNFDKIFCNDVTIEGESLPGECYHYQGGAGRAGIIMHLAGMLPAGFLVCFQFVPVIRLKLLLFHRINGYLILLLSLVGSIGVFMITRDVFGGGLYVQIVSGLGLLMFLVSLAISYFNIKRLQIEQHRAWMIRAWVYAGFILTMRIITIIAIKISMRSDSDYYETKECAVLDYMYMRNQMAVEANFPDCRAYYSGANPEQRTVVHATIDGKNLGEIAVAFTSTFGAAAWLALAIHAIGAEIYLQLTPVEAERLRRISYQRQLEAGMKNPGNAGLTVQRLGDAEPWIPPHQRTSPIAEVESGELKGDDVHVGVASTRTNSQ